MCFKNIKTKKTINIKEGVIVNKKYKILKVIIHFIKSIGKGQYI